MNKGKIKATILILVLLVVTAAVAAIATGRTVKNGGGTAQNTARPAQTRQAQESETPSGPPEESAQPSGTPAPAETEAPAETAAPVVSRSVSGSGSFTSDTGTAMNLVVNYSATAKSDSEINLTFDLYLNCYTINATAKPGGASVTFNGQTYTMSTPELSSSSATPTSVKLCSTTVTVPLAAGESLNVPVTASWAFGGKYSDVDLATIDAAGTLSIQG